MLGGLIAGDNVVWVYDDPDVATRFENAFLEEGARLGEPCYFVTTRESPSQVTRRLGAHTKIIDARPGKPFADPVLLEQTLIDAARGSLGRFAIDGLDAFVHRLGEQRALGFFSRVCPQLFDIGAVAYWRAPSRTLGNGFLDGVRKVTQCVLQVKGGQLRILKSEGHRIGTEGRLLKIEPGGDGGLKLRAEGSVGRLASGLRRIREQRHLTQAELARLGGVTPSAISQAEAGHRGLSLDTVVTLSEQLQLSIDDLLAYEPRADYVLARRERAGNARSQTPLLDDPDLGIRAYLVQIPPGETGSPPMLHKGVELVVVASGLVQLDLGSAMPVMRAGDAVLATRVVITGWRNLLGEPARLFWILRD